MTLSSCLSTSSTAYFLWMGGPHLRIPASGLFGLGLRLPLGGLAEWTNWLPAHTPPYRGILYLRPSVKQANGAVLVPLWKGSMAGRRTSRQSVCSVHVPGSPRSVHLHRYSVPFVELTCLPGQLWKGQRFIQRWAFGNQVLCVSGMWPHSSLWCCRIWVTSSTVSQSMNVWENRMFLGNSRIWQQYWI